MEKLDDRNDPWPNCAVKTLFTSYIHTILIYTVLEAVMSDLALSVLRNQRIVVNLEWLNLQALGSLGLPRNKRTVVPLFTCLFKL
jgi:hypothetical protein